MKTKTLRRINFWLDLFLLGMIVLALITKPFNVGWLLALLGWFLVALDNFIEGYSK